MTFSLSVSLTALLAIADPAPSPHGLQEPSPRPTTISVKIESVQPARSTVIVVLWRSQDGFGGTYGTPGNQAVQGVQHVKVPAPKEGDTAEPTSVLATFGEIPPGRYALTALQDLDGSGDLDQDYLGRPLEPFVVSGEKARPSTFKSASFEVSAPHSMVLSLVKPRSQKGTFDLSVTVSPKRSDKGNHGAFRVCLWKDEAGFPIDFGGKGVAAIRRTEPVSVSPADVAMGSSVTVLFRAVPRGEYALTAFQDLDDDGKVDRNFFGKPTEPVGLSNNPPRRMSMPRFEPSAIQLDRSRSLNIRLR